MATELENAIATAERVMGAFVKLTYNFREFYLWTLEDPELHAPDECAHVDELVRGLLAWAHSMPGAGSFDIDGNKVR